MEKGCDNLSFLNFLGFLGFVLFKDILVFLFSEFVKLRDFLDFMSPYEFTKLYILEEVLKFWII